MRGWRRSGRGAGEHSAKDPRIALAIFDIENPYHSVEIRGTAELVEDPGKDLRTRLSQRHLNEDPPPEPDEVVRLVVRVIPEKVNRFAA